MTQGLTPPAHIQLVVFGESREYGALKKTLFNNGHRLSLVHGAAWLTQGATSCGAHSSLLFFGLREIETVALLSALSKRTLPTLGVFSHDHVLKPELTLAFDDFVRWPCEQNEFALRLARLLPESAILPAGHDDQALIDEFSRLNMVGSSPVFLEALSLIKRTARCEIPVLIEGETGTGKELAARAVHYLGPRRDYPFIPVNCGAIPDTLVESEFFGHARGAFTDAKEARTGLIAQAQGGSLFLDEIDALSPKAQVVLLRFLQDQQYRVLGGQRYLQADIRLITACNTNLEKRVEDGAFRQDLLFRLKIMAIPLPPLRERRGDVWLLAEHFLERFSHKYQQPTKKVDPQALAWLERHAWPGNVRELENLIHREFVLAEGEVVRLHAGDAVSRERRKNPLDRRNPSSVHAYFNQAKEKLILDFERQYVTTLLRETHGNVSLAAKRAGTERRVFGKLLKKHGIDRSQFFPNTSD